MPKLTIDGQEIEVEQGTSILQAAEQLGIEIPRFCYHDKLSVPANCRMCLVEVVGGPPKPQASCALACSDGMEVRTDSDMVYRARKGVMEFLLINHPLDCPICDQGGECDLQDQAMGYGYDRSRYLENKRAVKNKNLGPLIKTVMTRCIHCTRCVRFGEEVAGMTEMGVLNRGEDVEIGTFIETAVASELSGNMIDICPVGALTSKPYAFQARPWELRKVETIDVLDAVGSNIRVDVRGNEVMRVLPRLNEDINEEWISDKTRFSYDGLKRQRLDRPYIRMEGRLTPVTWDKAFEFAAEKLKSFKPDEVAALAGDLVDVESTYALKGLISGLGSPHMDCRIDGARYDTSSRSGYLFNTGIASIEAADAILIVGSVQRYEASLINARIRKAWRKTKLPIAVIGAAEDLTYPYEHLGCSAQDIETLMKARSGFAKTLKDAKKPMIIVGQGALRRSDGAAVYDLCAKLADKFGMVSPEWNGFNVLHTAAGRVGALDVGFLPQKHGKDIYGIVEASQKGEVKAVYLHGVDNLDVREAFGKDCFVIYQGHHGDNGAKAADVIFPSAAYTEKEALYVNTEGRVQLGRQAAFPPGEAKEDWKILRAFSQVLDVTLPYDSLHDLRGCLVKDFSHFQSVGERVHSPFKPEVISEGGEVSAESFAPVVPNFYQTDPITRASVTMAKCTDELLKARQEKQRTEAAE